MVYPNHIATVFESENEASRTVLQHTIVPSLPEISDSHLHITPGP